MEQKQEEKTAGLSNESTVQELMLYVKKFCDDRDWDQFHNPKDLAIGIATEAGELLDHFRFKDSEQTNKVMEDPESREAVEEELSDVLYFVLRFAERNDIDLGRALENKIRIDARKYPVELSKGRNLKYTELKK